MNWVVRAHRASDTSPTSVIVKRFGAHAASAPEIALDPDRFLFEARALKAAPALLDRSQVSVPKLLAELEHERLLVLEDLREGISLESWLPETTVSGAHTIGQRIGHAIGSLHRNGSDAHLRKDFDNRKTQQARLDNQYAHVGEWLGR